MKKVFLLLLVLSLNISVVSAETCAEQLARAKAAAEKVKVSHEAIEKRFMAKKYNEETHEFTDETYEAVDRSLRIDVFNITPDIFIVRKERLNYEDGIVTAPEEDENGVPTNFDEFGNQLIITYKDVKDGKFSFSTDKIMSYKDYTFDIYPDNDKSCDLTKLKTISYRQPRYNTYSELPICQEYPTVELCKTFISYDFELNEKDFTEEVLKRVKNSSDSKIVTKKATLDEREPNFLRDNWLYLTIGGVVLIGGISIYVIISKKRSSL